jgi:hypothetical protein
MSSVAAPKVDHRKVNNPKQQSVAAARMGTVKTVPDSRFLNSPVWKPGDQKPVPLLELQSGQCKFPLGDPRDPDFGCCGQPAVKKPKVRETDPQGYFPYCPHHRAICTAKKETTDE